MRKKLANRNINLNTRHGDDSDIHSAEQRHKLFRKPVTRAMTLGFGKSKGGDPLFLQKHFDSFKDIFVFQILGFKVEFATIVRLLVSYFGSLWIIVAAPILAYYAEVTRTGGEG